MKYTINYLVLLVHFFGARHSVPKNTKNTLYDKYLVTQSMSTKKIVAKLLKIVEFVLVAKNLNT